ncbi:MAG TPA: hypothetical protein PL044_02935 [Clostridiales bacterium]|nr:MAG: hypothetical protein BWY37_00523 [Firmicutes bacterium ADurb.Bin262]HQK72717.1 hypothetical protein [Clostridiales bacterium]
MAAPQSNAQEIELDGAGIIYAVTNSKTWNRVYRVAAVVKEDVRPDILAQAVADLRPRFPTFYTQLDQDFFNYKLRTVEDTDVVLPESAYPCGRIEAGSGERPLFRVFYFRNRISLEIFHIVTDGGGALIFLKNIAARYLELQGFAVEKTDGVLDPGDAPSAAETGDAYQTIAGGKTEKTSRVEAFAYHYKQPVQEGLFQLTHGFLPVAAMKRLTAEKGVTVTEYLTALYTWALFENMLPADNRKPVKIAVPTDLRRILGSSTLRGFSLYVNTCAEPGPANRDFDRLLNEIAAQLRKGFQKDSLAARAAANTAAQNSWLYRYTPLVLKKAVLKQAYLILGERTMTTALTNLGVVKMPEGMEEHVDHFDFVAGGTLANYLTCAVIACNGVINVTFSSRSVSTDVQQSFFSFLAKRGVPVETQSNVKQKDAAPAAMLRCGECEVVFKDNHLCCPLCGGPGEKTENPIDFMTVPYPEKVSGIR